MIYQGTAYNYNQRAEMVLPSRRGTTYNQPQNHKPFILYTGIDSDIEFFVSDADRKPVDLEGKTFIAKIIDRYSKAALVTKTLVPLNPDLGGVVMQISASDSSSISAGLYDLVITYTNQDGRKYGLYSDQNARLTYTVEVKNNPEPATSNSSEATEFSSNGSDTDALYSSFYASTAQSYNQDGTNTCAVYLTNYSGTFYAQGTLDLQPTEADWFSIRLDPENSEDSWTFDGYTGVIPFTWDGMFQWVRFYHVPDTNNEGTLDKVLYRG